MTTCPSENAVCMALKSRRQNAFTRDGNLDARPFMRARSESFLRSYQFYSTNGGLGKREVGTTLSSVPLSGIPGG